MTPDRGSRALGWSAAALVTGAAWHAVPALTARGPLRRHVGPAGGPDGVALTFDDGPHPEGTPAVLAQLAALGWTATFFLLGSEVRRSPDIARTVVHQGHRIAVHGDEHRNHLVRSPRWVAADLERAVGSITQVTGVRPRWFRPPYGVLSGGSLAAARRLGLSPVLWTAWGRDWERTTPGRVVHRLSAGLRPGATLLLHDSDATSAPGSWRTTVAALPILAAELKHRGLVVGPLREDLRSRK